MRRRFAQPDLVVQGRTHGIVAGPEPLQTDQGKPAIRLQQLSGVLGAPGGRIFFKAMELAMGSQWAGGANRIGAETCMLSGAGPGREEFYLPLSERFSPMA